MAMMKRAAAISAGVEAARRFARNNPDKARTYVDKAARFADQRTKGKYSRQIDSFSTKAVDYVAGPAQSGRNVPGQASTSGSTPQDPFGSRPQDPFGTRR